MTSSMPPKVGKSAADLKYLPAIFGRTDSQGVPVYNLVIVAVLMSAATLLTISPTLNEQFTKIAEMSVLACLLAYIYACASVWRYPGVATPASYRWLSLGAIALCGWVVATSSSTMLVLAGAAVVIVSAIFLFARRDRSIV